LPLADDRQELLYSVSREGVCNFQTLEARDDENTGIGLAIVKIGVGKEELSN